MMSKSNRTPLFKELSREEMAHAQDEEWVENVVGTRELTDQGVGWTLTKEELKAVKDSEATVNHCCPRFQAGNGLELGLTFRLEEEDDAKLLLGNESDVKVNLDYTVLFKDSNGVSLGETNVITKKIPPNFASNATMVRLGNLINIISSVLTVEVKLRSVTLKSHNPQIRKLQIF